MGFPILFADSSSVYVQACLDGLSMGALFALIALGYTMVYGIIELINFAHGDLFMLGAFCGLTVLSALGLTGAGAAAAGNGKVVLACLLMLLAVPVFCAAVNWSVDRAIYKPLRNAPKLAPLVSAIGVSFVFMNFGLFWNSLIPENGQSVPAAGDRNFPKFEEQLDGNRNLLGTRFQLTNASIDVLRQEKVPEAVLQKLTTLENRPFNARSDLERGISIILDKEDVERYQTLILSHALGEESDLRFTVKDALVIGITVPIMILLTLFVKYTPLGKAMRATAQNPTAARLMGIDVDRVIGATFMIGGALAGVGSVIYALSVGTIGYQIGFQNGLYAFTAAVLGGIGNIPGAVLGGVLIGLTRSFGSALIGEKWTSALVFVILIVILVFRPTGLLGARTREKV